MDITFGGLFFNCYNLIKNKITTGLSPLQKKVALIAAGYIGCATIGYFIYRCCFFKNHKINVKREPKLQVDEDLFKGKKKEYSVEESLQLQLEREQIARDEQSKKEELKRKKIEEVRQSLMRDLKKEEEAEQAEKLKKQEELKQKETEETRKAEELKKQQEDDKRVLKPDDLSSSPKLASENLKRMQRNIQKSEYQKNEEELDEFKKAMRLLESKKIEGLDKGASKLEDIKKQFSPLLSKKELDRSPIALQLREISIEKIKKGGDVEPIKKDSILS